MVVGKVATLSVAVVKVETVLIVVDVKVATVLEDGGGKVAVLEVVNVKVAFLLEEVRLVARHL